MFDDENTTVKGQVRFDTSREHNNLGLMVGDTLHAGGEIREKDGVFTAHPYGLNLTSQHCKDLSELLDDLNNG